MLKFVIAVIAYCYSVYLIGAYLSTPVMYESWEQRKCAFIEYPDGSRKGCDELKLGVRYIHQWCK